MHEAKYEQIDDRRTRISGAQWLEAPQITIKIEGSTRVGERAILLCGAADPIFIKNHEEILRDVTKVVRDLVCEDAPEDYTLFWRVFGVNGVTDPLPDAVTPSEICMTIECIAPK